MLSRRRFGESFEDPVILFGAMVEYYPISSRSWKGDILVSDIEVLGKLDASEINAGRLNAKEVIASRNGEKFLFPIADGRAKLRGRHHGAEDL